MTLQTAGFHLQAIFDVEVVAHLHDGRLHVQLLAPAAGSGSISAAVKCQLPSAASALLLRCTLKQPETLPPGHELQLRLGQRGSIVVHALALGALQNICSLHAMPDTFDCAIAVVASSTNQPSSRSAGSRCWGQRLVQVMQGPPEGLLLGLEVRGLTAPGQPDERAMVVSLQPPEPGQGKQQRCRVGPHVGELRATVLAAAAGQSVGS